MMAFQVLGDAPQHRHSRLFVGFVDLDQLKTARQCGIFFKILFVFRPGGRADGAQLSTCQRRFKQVGGITGALLTGVFAAPSLGGAGIWDYVTETALPEYDMAGQVWIQAQGVLTTIVLSGVVALIAFLIVKYTVGLRVSEEAEREGLDITSHGEAAYEA